MSPGLLPTDQNGSLAAIAAPLAPNLNGSPGGPPMPEGPSGPQAAAPSVSGSPQGGGPTPTPPPDPDLLAIAANAGMDPDTLSKLPPDIQAAAKAAWKTVKDKKNKVAELDDIAKQLGDPGWVQKNAGISTKPSDMLKDALYNITQLGLRNPTYGSLAGQPFVPIQQQRLTMAMELHKQRIAAAAQQRMAVNEELQDANSNFANLTKVMQLDAGQQKLAQQKQIADEKRASNEKLAKLMNDYRYAKIMSDAGVKESQVNLNQARTALAAEIMQDKISGGGALAAIQRIKDADPTMTDTEARDVLRLAQMAYKPEAGAPIYRSTDAWVPDPANPMQLKKVTNNSVTTRGGFQNAGVPQFVPPGQPATGGPGSVSSGANISAPPVATRINPKGIPNETTYNKAVGQLQQIELARDTIMRLYKVAPQMAGNLGTKLQLYMSEHPDTYITRVGSEILGNTKGAFTEQEAQYIADIVRLKEDVNLLRAPLGSTGFRGEHGWNALQALVGNSSSRPEIQQAEWRNLMQQYLALASDTRKIIKRHDGGNPSPAASPNAEDYFKAYALATNNDDEAAKKLIRRHYGPI